VKEKNRVVPSELKKCEEESREGGGAIRRWCDDGAMLASSMAWMKIQTPVRFSSMQGRKKRRSAVSEELA